MHKMESSERIKIFPLTSPVLLFVNRIETRIENEYKSLDLNPISHFTLIKNRNELFEWHFILHGPEDSPFKSGEYHGDILFPSDFPYSSPKIRFNTYNGRLLRGANITIIEDKWWNASMSVRDVLIELLSIFYNRTPKPDGMLFEEEYRLRILAEKSQYSECLFCSKECMESASNLSYVAFWKKWKDIEEDTSNMPIGNWWNELREAVISHEEAELKRISERRYDLYMKKAGEALYSYILLFNWKTLARHVIVPIVYRLVLLPILFTCFIMTILLIYYSYFDWNVRITALIDAIAIFIIGLDQVKAVCCFVQPKQLRGNIKKISNISFFVAIGATIVHVALAIILLIFVTDTKYTEHTTEIIIYTITAFIYDIYHYIVGIVIGLSFLLYYMGGAIEYLITCKLISNNKIYKGEIKSCIEKGMCNVCKDEIIEKEEVYVLECNEEHVFHKQCLYDLSHKVKRCPLCKKRIKLINT